MAFNPLEILLLVLPVVVAYGVIRLGVRHGVMDAQRRLPPRDAPPT